MSPEALEDAARALYDAFAIVKPEWSQLGEATKSVWREEALARAPVAQVPPSTPQLPGATSAPQAALF